MGTREEVLGGDQRTREGSDSVEAEEENQGRGRVKSVSIPSKLHQGKKNSRLGELKSEGSRSGGPHDRDVAIERREGGFRVSRRRRREEEKEGRRPVDSRVGGDFESSETTGGDSGAHDETSEDSLRVGGSDGAGEDRKTREGDQGWIERKEDGRTRCERNDSQVSNGPEEDSTGGVETESHENGLWRKGRKEEREIRTSFRSDFVLLRCNSPSCIRIA